MILYTKNNSLKKIYISESRLLALEGIDWTRLDNGMLNLSVNQRKDNNSNKGTKKKL